VKPSRQLAIVIAPSLLSVVGLAGSVTAAPTATTATTFRHTVRDPAHDVQTITANRPYTPSDDLRKVTLRHDAKRVTIAFKTVKFVGHVRANTEFHYSITIDRDIGDPIPTWTYMLGIDLGGSKAVLPNSTRVPHHKHLWEETNVILIKNGEISSQETCGGQLLVPSTKQHVWIDRVPDSCLPHFHKPVTLAGSRERQVNEPHNQPAHDFEDDFSD
jgi:hypothetical protein